MAKFIYINPRDTVVVALEPLPKGVAVEENGLSLCPSEDIPQGHKVAVKPMAKGEEVIKYGFPIGRAKTGIQPGEWVHVHNLGTNLSEEAEYRYAPVDTTLPKLEGGTFQGFLREDGRAGVRNEIWILPTVGCVNGVATQLALQNAFLTEGTTVDGIYAFPHPYGCSQMGQDHENTRRILTRLAKHPNAGGVLVVGLGCENLTMDQFKAELGEWDERRVKFMICQDSQDEFEEGASLLKELCAFAAEQKRQPIGLEKLVVGLKCGGSDGLSGITANPTVGAFSDKLIAGGGSAILTEVPEMFGAEGVLFNRAVSREVFDKAVDMVNGFKDYFVSHGQTVYENPSPGNKQGGISTLEDKSLGCVQKGGTSPISDVIPYGATVQAQGLTLLSGPGNDLVSTTALSAAGAQIILFTTGRGTPFGAPVPTLKISTNTALYKHKSGWIDFNAGTAAEGESIAQTGSRLYDLVLQVASGETQTQSEKHGFREMAIFKDGVVL